MVNSISQANNAEKNPRTSHQWHLQQPNLLSNIHLRLLIAFVIDCRTFGFGNDGVTPWRAFVWPESHQISKKYTRESRCPPLFSFFFVGRGLFIQWRIKSCRCYLHCPQSRIQIREENLLNTENEQITGRAIARWVLSSSMNTDIDFK